MSKPLFIVLTMPEVYQLQAYVKSAETEGWYYGPKEAFMKRHENIKKVLLMSKEEGKP